MSRIIYVNPVTNILAVMTAMGSATDEETAIANVPRGCKFKIVDDSEIPSDRSFRNAWVIDESELTDGVGENDNYSQFG